MVKILYQFNLLPSPAVWERWKSADIKLWMSSCWQCYQQSM